MKAIAKPQVDSNLILSSQVAQALAIIGDRWAFLIIRDVYLGVRHFEDLRKRIGAARGTLASRLKSLVKKGILYKKPYQTSPVRYDYRLTEKGLDLYPMVLMIWAWDHNWGKHSGLPRSLFHKSCGKDMVPIYRCSACKEKVQPQDVRFSPGDDFAKAKKISPRYQRRSKSKLEKSGDFGANDVSAVDCIGDRWTSMVLAAGFFGLKRFDDIASAIGIATNILADRLSLLVQGGVLERVPYRDRPVRHEYRLSQKGRDLYAHTVALHDWANRWLIPEGKEPLLLQHLPCGQPFHGEAVCSECEQVLYPKDVRYSPDQARQSA